MQLFCPSVSGYSHFCRILNEWILNASTFLLKLKYCHADKAGEVGRGENWERLGSAGIVFTSLSKFRGKEENPQVICAF